MLFDRYFSACKFYCNHIDNSLFIFLHVYICKVNHWSCHNSNSSKRLHHVTKYNPSYQLYSCLIWQVDAIYLLGLHASPFFCVYDLFLSYTLLLNTFYVTFTITMSKFIRLTCMWVHEKIEVTQYSRRRYICLRRFQESIDLSCHVIFVELRSLF